MENEVEFMNAVELAKLDVNVAVDKLITGEAAGNRVELDAALAALAELYTSNPELYTARFL